MLAMSSRGSTVPCILVVDDEPGMRETLADVLEASGYDVHTAESGEAGIIVPRIL
jgi:CheY-like chemotaxis protein